MNNLTFPNEEHAFLPLLNEDMTSNKKLKVLKTDIIMSKRADWDISPVVLQKYKLVFFTVAKVGCTTWKQFFRRVEGKANWQSQLNELPHNPHTNSLVYLNQLNTSYVAEIMQDPSWTKALFVREPKQRFLSAFLDKAVSNDGQYFGKKCCTKLCVPWNDQRNAPSCRKCIQEGAKSVSGFLEKTETCHNAHWDVIADRIDSKYWKYINYVGRMENLAEDGPRLIKRLGNDLWENYGKSGWGKYGNASMFSKADHNHVTGASTKVWQWYTPEIERMVEERFAKDYNLFQYEKRTLTAINDDFVKSNDSIWNFDNWDIAPIVVPKYKLIFFSMPRVGAATWKRAFRRMEGFDNWKDFSDALPHDPKQNGLKYLYHYSLKEASDMMTSDEWTKAIFVRNPKDRFLSVYAHYQKSSHHLNDLCCPMSGDCHHAAASFQGFLSLMQDCRATDWNLQSDRMDSKYWEHINFIGHLETAQEDSEKLLKQIGAWEEIGKSGWGISGNDPIFTPTGHEYDSAMSALAYYTPAVNELVEKYYEKDYQNELFQFPKIPNVLLRQGNA